ncbi:MAG: amidase domain-containing protein [Bacillota bacterium]|nr:amidase domain-containing protein [Bacillota bacterium]
MAQHFYVLIKRKLFIFLLTVLIALTNSSSLTGSIYAMEANETLTSEQMKEELERIYNMRSKSLVSGELLPLKELFDISQKYGVWALEHEVRRVKYLTQWADDRDIILTNIQNWVRVKKVYPKGKIIKAALEESYKFDYVYSDDERNIPNSFGVGIRHTASLIKKNGKWMIYNDWYTDCFEDAMQAYSGQIPDAPAMSRYAHRKKDYKKAGSDFKPFYNRENAVAYADKYCGAAWGSQNNFKYNKKYNDYNGIGGDCTNFASQVLADKEGGGMPLGGGWLPYSRAWANADGLKDFLIGSGRGSLISIGTFKELTEPRENFHNGVVSKLKLGDLIAYEKGRGNIDHFAVITGFDSKGYPLVNSHTTDRYHVPWDLGWGDKKIRFFLIHING